MSDRQLAAVGKMWPQQASQPMRMAENWSGGRPRPGDAYSERILDGWQILSDLGAGWLLDVLDVAEEPGAHNLLGSWERTQPGGSQIQTHCSLS